MSDQPPTEPARPTLQAGAPLVPEGTSPVTTPAGDPRASALVSTDPVALARADLASRRAVSPDTIQVLEVRDVTWPNPGLGCPQPGMNYKQVPIDGLLIRLESGGQLFNYHSGGSRAPFLCEQPASVATPAAGGESN